MPGLVTGRQLWLLPFWSLVAQLPACSLPAQGHTRSHGEGVPEAADGLLRLAAGEPLESDGAGVAHVMQGCCDRAVGDLAGARFAAAGHVGDLYLADPRQRAPAQLDQVPLPDLGVVEVEHETKVRVVHRLHQREAVLR